MNGRIVKSNNYKRNILSFFCGVRKQKSLTNKAIERDAEMELDEVKEKVEEVENEFTSQAIEI